MYSDLLRMSTRAVATHNFTPVEYGDLGFQKGDTLLIIAKVRLKNNIRDFKYEYIYYYNILTISIIRATVGGRQN